jgi:hypothetical protein
MASNYSDIVSVSTCTNGADKVFGPVVAPPCRRGFDFTLLFEQSIFSIGPSCIFLLVVPLRLFWLYRSKVTVVPRYSAYTRKAVCLFCLNPSYLLQFSANYHIKSTSGSHITPHWASASTPDTMDDQLYPPNSSFCPVRCPGIRRRTSHVSSLIPRTHSIRPPIHPT